MNKIDLNGRCAVVTGGAQGFGRAITERFVASGARVAIWDHDQPFAEKTAKQIGPDVTAFAVDVSDLAAGERARDATLKTLGKIDILVNNAGIAGINKTVWETDLEEWRKVLRINLDGPFICCKAIVPSMVQQNYGRIVNIASDSARTGEHSMSVYAAAKAGVIGLSKSLAKEVGRDGVTVNVVAPGTTATPGSSAFIDAVGGAEKIARSYPLGRIGEPADIANAVLFFASPLASWITGQTLSVSGGFTMI